MSHRSLPLAAAMLALSGVCSMAEQPPYSVQLVNSGASSPGTQSPYQDVQVVNGIKVKALLDNSTPSPNQKKLGEVAFMRDWDGDTVLSSQVGQKSGGIPFTDVLIWLNATDTQAASANAVDLGQPYFDEWSLVAENGALVVEAARFCYSSRGIVPVPTD